MMRIGFAKTEITPPLGTELGGYAGYRPCSGVHDPLWCKAVVLDQMDGRYGLIVLDLLCVDESLYLRIADAVHFLGIKKEKLIVSAIHTHASPRGLIPGEGALAAVNSPSAPKDPGFPKYMETVVEATARACAQAVASREGFQVRAAQGALPAVGSERHTGAPVGGKLTVIQCRTDSGKVLTVYNFPCHPTVTNAANLLVSTDFVADIEALVGGDMAVFVNGAAGDVSTRYTRKESTFDECARMGRIAATQILSVIDGAAYQQPEPLRGRCSVISLRARHTEPPEEAEKRVTELTAQWQAAQAAGADPTTLRMLKSYAEGAGVNLQFARTMGDIRQLDLPVTVFRWCGMDFASVPGELFSALQPPDVAIIGYANGYFRYFGGEAAYEAGHYEALAAIIARGEGERLVEQILLRINELKYNRGA